MLVAAGVDSPLWRSMVRGEPVGLETRLSDGERAEAALLNAAFTRMGYGLDAVAKGARVPPLFLPAVPGDLDELPETADKKQVFLRVMLPLVLVVNEEIAEDRRRLEAMAANREPRDEAWLAELATRYGADGTAPAQLLRRVDVVPPSLALAQAAEESGWGTSRFVREANNLFGHVGDDVVPQGDADGPRMAAFASLHEAVRAYVHNLNSHPAYETLRRARAAARARGAFPDGHTLAGSLVNYSERRGAYVDTIRALIRANRLLRFDHARLDRGVAS
ncbi:MAG: glucosaminidase domain-containing protein [Bacteroidales bacterium]